MVSNKLLVIRRRFLKSLNLLPLGEQLIRKVEFIRGLYQHPNKMIGRKLPPINHHYITKRTDVLVFAAHSDDEVLGLGASLYRHSAKGDNIKIVFTTNGSADWYGLQSWHIKTKESTKRAEIRYKEAVNALSLLNIPKENIYCLGYPDGGSQRYLKNMEDDIQFLMKTLNPGKVYVHCIEGGHVDHDMTSFVVKTTCKKIGFNNVFEWAEYNPKQPIGTKNIKFLPNPVNTFKETILDITEEERHLKRMMLSCHKSQQVEEYYAQGEALRQANLKNVEIELMEHCQLPKFRLHSIVKKYNKPFINKNKGDIRTTEPVKKYFMFLIAIQQLPLFNL
ncbi:PIG-L deacetylase family protein [Peribacillus sp. SCS-155]|uniref:PIG-L deacetylase family protein n=1 Tax=Peribacillus sedimenti TaxID=3115297 RepID=UPI003905F5A7